MCTNTTKIHGISEIPNTDFGIKKKNPNHTVSKKTPINTKQWAKYISSNVATSLATANENSPLNKSYWNTYHCNQVIRFDESGKGTSSYCKNRWCYTCNRIRTARLIKGYLSELEQFSNAQFVTLTKPTCTAKELPGRIEEMQKTFSKINDLARKNKYLKSVKGTNLEYKGLRKLECTLRPNDLYHPHFHVICNTKEQAEFIRNEWIKKNPDADIKAQDIRPADKRSYKELFKYFTKLSTGKRKPGEALTMDYKRLDVMFQAMKGRVVFKSFGALKMVKEDFEDDDLNATLNLGTKYANDIFSWVDNQSDWLCQDTGELLVAKPIPTKVKNLLPQKVEEKEAIERTDYLPPLTGFATLNDAFDLEDVPTPYYIHQREEQAKQERIRQIIESNIEQAKQEKNTIQLEMAMSE